MEALLSNELWNVVAPLLPRRRVNPKGGRPRVDDRAVLSGIVFVLRSGIPWHMLPKAMGCGSGVTCWRRLREWQRRGVWKRLHRMMLERLAAVGHLDWTRASLDSRSLPSKHGGAATVKLPRSHRRVVYDAVASRSARRGAARSPGPARTRPPGGPGPARAARETRARPAARGPERSYRCRCRRIARAWLTGRARGPPGGRQPPERAARPGARARARRRPRRGPRRRTCTRRCARRRAPWAPPARAAP